jgi:hypothetical protein
MLVDLCIIVQFTKKNPTRCNNVSKFYYSNLYKAQHVSGDSGRHSQVVGGRCQAHFAWQRPPTTCPTTFHVWKTRGCQCSFRLLMMGGVSPETCWASYKHGIIHCLLDFSLWNCTMMHGSTNIKYPPCVAKNLLVVIQYCIHITRTYPMSSKCATVNCVLQNTHTQFPKNCYVGNMLHSVYLVKAKYKGL